MKHAKQLSECYISVLISDENVLHEYWLMALERMVDLCSRCGMSDIMLNTNITSFYLK